KNPLRKAGSRGNGDFREHFGEDRRAAATGSVLNALRRIFLASGNVWFWRTDSARWPHAAGPGGEASLDQQTRLRRRPGISSACPRSLSSPTRDLSGIRA